MDWQIADSAIGSDAATAEELERRVIGLWTLWRRRTCAKGWLSDRCTIHLIRIPNGATITASREAPEWCRASRMQRTHLQRVAPQLPHSSATPGSQARLIEAYSLNALGGEEALVNGEWWIENRADPPEGYREPPDHTVAGTLEDSGNDQWTLETIGGVGGQSLLERLGGKTEALSGPVTIWGVAADHRAFSLLNCYTTLTTVHFGSLREGTERWEVGTIVDGDGIWVDPDTVVDEITIDYQNLASWAWDRDERGAEPEFHEELSTLSISLINKVEEARARECPVHLLWGRSATISDGPINIWPSAHFKIVDSVRIADVADKWVFPIGQLLSLLALGQCSVASVQARISSELPDGRVKNINIRFPQSSVPSDEQDGKTSLLERQLEMPANRIALKEKGVDLAALLTAFFEFRENPRLSDALSHFLESQSRAKIGEVDEALRCLFNAFENFHAFRFEGGVEDGEALSAVLKELIETTPVEYRDEVALRLGRRRQKPPKQKLQDLVDICGETASRMLALRPELVADAKEARNEIAHANPKSASRWKRHTVLMDLQWLMRHALLQQLGVQPSDCDDLFLQEFRPFSRHVGRQ